MPIKNLTDRETIKPRLPRLGKLRKGGEKTNPKKPGPDLNYFRFTSENPKIVEAFYSAYNEKPGLINALIFQQTTEEAFPSWIECWDASGLVFRSDGDNWILWRDGSRYSQEAKPHVDHKDQFEVGRLEIIIPELLQQGFVGTVTLETHSNHDLRHITSVLMAAEQERGNLRGTQFVLRRVEEEISIPGWGDREGQRSKSKKWLVKLELPRRLFNNLLNEPDKPLELAAPDWQDVEPIEFEQLPPAPRQPTKQARPKAQPAAQKKLPDWPTAGKPKEFCDDVRERTQYYSNQYQLKNAIGDFGNLNDTDNYAAKLSAAIDHANEKTQSATQESMLPEV